MSEPGTRLEEITANATTQGASAPDLCSVDSASTLHRMRAGIVCCEQANSHLIAKPRLSVRIASDLAIYHS
jgi:hypothetical protein